MYYPMFYFDPTYMLVIVGVIICLLASAKIALYVSEVREGAQSFRYDRQGGCRGSASPGRYL